jgi:predicted HicB family RNase H-like nuclease
MNDREAHEFYKDPANLAITGPGHRRVDGPVVSVRLPQEMADGVAAEAARTHTTVSAVVRRALQPVLERALALWLDEHRDDPDMWEAVSARSVSPRKLASQFSVRVEGDEMWAVVEAARRHGMTVSAFMRAATRAYADEDKVLPARTFSCQHMSIGNVQSASCGICGSLQAVA